MEKMAKGIVVPTEKFNEIAGTSYHAVQVTMMPDGEIRIELRDRHYPEPRYLSPGRYKLTTHQVAKLIHDMYEELNAFRDAAVKYF